MDSSSSSEHENSLGSPKKFKGEQRRVWLEDLFVTTPTYSFETYKAKFDEIIGNCYQNNPALMSSMPKEILVRNLEKLAYHKLFLETDNATKAILEQTGVIMFNESSEFKFQNGYDHYLATCFITNNISENNQEVILENIFKPENYVVKFFVNEIAEQNKNDRLYTMWNKVLYSKLFPSAKENISPVTQENPSDYGISAVIQKVLHEITGSRPENLFGHVQDYLQVCKKYNMLDLNSYQSILTTLLYKLVIADLQNGKPETSYSKLLRYSTFYQCLLLKTVLFEGKAGLTSQEILIISNVKDLIEEVKLKIDEIYLSPDKEMDWLERDGLYLASFLKHLTEKMVLKYMSVFNKLPYDGGFKLIYAERIYTYFIKPILNSTADEGIPEIDQADFINLFVPITQYMHDTEQLGIKHGNHFTRKVLFLTEKEWKGLRMWLENSEENGRNVIRQSFEKYEVDMEQTTKKVLSMELC